MRGAAIAVCVVVLAGRASAGPAAGRAAAASPVVVAIAPGPENRDARQAMVVGPAGQTYEPDGKGAWVRRHAGGIADDVIHVARAGQTVIASVQAGPPFELRAGVWSSVHLALKARAQLGRGTRATATVGKSVFAFDKGAPAKLPDAPGIVAAIGASPRGVAIETDKGLLRLAGATWKPIAKAPHHVTVLLDDRWAIVERGLLDLQSQKITPWPAGFRVADAVAVGADVVVAAGTLGRSAELVTLRAGKLEHAPITLDHAAPIAGLVADKAGRVVVATRDGQLAIREREAWSAGSLSEDLPAPHAGPAPAVSK